jgi:hypothetical protein
VKTTVEIAGDLYERARRHAQRSGRPIRALIEDGLRMVLSEQDARPTYRLADRSVGDPLAEDPLEAMSWQDLRDEIYSGR